MLLCSTWTVRNPMPPYPKARVAHVNSRRHRATSIPWASAEHSGPRLSTAVPWLAWAVGRSAEVQGIDVARCLREVIWTTLASGYGGIVLSTVQVEHNSLVASFLAAHNACRVQSVYRHYDHQGDQDKECASHP